MLVEHSCKHSAVHLSWQVFGGLLQVRVKLYSIFHLQQLAQPPDLASPVSVLQYSTSTATFDVQENITWPEWGRKCELFQTCNLPDYPVHPKSKQ